jgi:signal transduction histidine kinase
VLISALLLVTVTLFAWTAYARVQRVVIAATAARLQSASSVTALLLGQAMGRYRSQLVQTAADSAVVGFLTTGRGRGPARQALGRAWVDETVPRGRIELRRPDGGIVLDTTRGGAPQATRWVTETIAAGSVAPGEAVIGPLHTTGPFIFTETVAAIAATRSSRAPGGGTDTTRRVVGYVSDLRFVTSTGGQAIRGLIGGRATVLIGSPAEGTWSDLERVVSAPPAAVQPGHSLVFSSSARGAGVGAATTIPGTSWVLWVEQPRDAILAPTHGLLWQLALLATVIVAAATAGAWVLSRRMTAPLVSLTAAAEELAPGASSAPSRGRPEDEIARLTEAFDRMAARVSESLALAQSARAEAEASNHAKDAFLATISHELRTPLNAITGYAALLQDGIRGPVSSAQAEDIARIRTAGHHLLGLINDLLNFAKLEAGEVRIASSDVAVGHVLSEAAAMVEPQARSKQLALEYLPISPVVVTRGDREKILQIVLNLLGNAIKFTQAGGRVTLTATVADDRVQILVRDTGRGIPANQLSRIFEPFVQVGRQLAAPGEGGVGLGLAISRELALAMGGELTAESVAGVGSTFTLVLARAAVHVAALEASGGLIASS